MLKVNTNKSSVAFSWLLASSELTPGGTPDSYQMFSIAVRVAMIGENVHLSLQVLGDEVEITDQGASVFQPAPRITEADHRKDTKSLQRALDKRLFLLVKAQGGTFPPTSQCCFSLSEMGPGENDTSSDPQSILRREFAPGCT